MGRRTRGLALTGSETPPLIYDYYGFPAHTYRLTYPAPGAPALAARAAALLGEAGFAASIDPSRGLDHGAFVPLKLAFPEADIPLVEMSLDRSRDPLLHLRAGQALAPLRDEGVLIIGSGMSFHNMRGYGDPRSTTPSEAFDAWLTETATLSGPERAERLARWTQAPSARFAHPEEEHLLPLMVAAGASEQPGQRIFHDLILETAISAFRFL
ncbi:aromatic ring-opening dioxygenase catalytic subunit (LigB family) [Endobacter medicaginis]|uniref:Aromatic ring-opening dioxygenase catalytic subunit (LigB family) n=2 Tax=Endobacter medicaginis TaxID=1181271 RepID=A0A839UXE0_9PROT|nr:aromatic ring-opening dioxygenase catalytic subunit (LigB family) [Endobacter medicaginis]MCX5475114.1 class III extradiol ring-cleavage dioxygenase [Endobacter medicaginis]